MRHEDFRRPEHFQRTLNFQGHVARNMPRLVSIRYCLNYSLLNGLSRQQKDWVNGLYIRRDFLSRS